MRNYLFSIDIIAIIIVSLFNGMYLRNENDKKMDTINYLNIYIFYTCSLFRLNVELKYVFMLNNL